MTSCIWRCPHCAACLATLCAGRLRLPSRIIAADLGEAGRLVRVVLWCPCCRAVCEVSLDNTVTPEYPLAVSA